MTFRILEGEEIQGGPPTGGRSLAILEPAGRLSLTIYVAHFAVLGIVAEMMYGQARLDVIPAFAATLIHTAIWIPLSILHERFISDYSLEKLLQKLSS
jgi:peptidoglycan/LPS O-acetylase OafA/YrhL